MVVRINTHIHTHTPTKPCCTPYTTRHCNSSNKISVRGRNRDWSDVTHTECIYTTRIPVRHCCRRLSQWAFTTTGVFTAGPCGFSFPRLPKLSPEKFPGVLPCGWTFQKSCLSIKRMYVIVQFSHCNSKVTSDRTTGRDRLMNVLGVLGWGQFQMIASSMPVCPSGYNTDYSWSCITVQTTDWSRPTCKHAVEREHMLANDNAWLK